MQNEAKQTSVTDLAVLQQENQYLRSQLSAFLKKRGQVRELKHKLLEAEYSVQQGGINPVLSQRNRCFEDFLATFASFRFLKRQLNNIKQCVTMSLNDFFHISTHGPFATINGLRLGSEAAVEGLEHSPLLMSGACSVCDGNASAGVKTVANSVSSFSIRGQARSEQLKEDAETGALSPKCHIRVPWSEINSALGQLALLLSMLEYYCGNNDENDNPFSYHYAILCMGSSSKMGIRKRNSSTGAILNVAWYNLFSDDSFHFFGRRSFNTALQCLIQCVSDAAQMIRRRDPTITLPHPISAGGATSATGAATSSWTPGVVELSIDGLSTVFGSDGIEWSRAMKYLLTDVKHLLLYWIVDLRVCSVQPKLNKIAFLDDD